MFNETKLKNVEDNFQYYTGLSTSGQNKNKGSSASLFNYLSANRIEVDKVVDLWDRVLKLDENAPRNSITSLDRYYSDKENLIFQTMDGEIIQMNIQSGKVIKRDENWFINYAGEKGLFGQDKNGTNVTVAPGVYDYIDFDGNDFTVHDYRFTGWQNGKSDFIKTGKYIGNEELILTTMEGRMQMNDILDEYRVDHGIIKDFKNIFGDQQGQAHDVLYYNNDAKATIVAVQDGRALRYQSDKATGDVTYRELDAQFLLENNEITQAQADKILSITWSIDDNNKLHYKIKNKDGSTGSGSTDAAGDPHFHHNGQFVFDYQGPSSGKYNMLKNNDVSLTATFAAYAHSELARVISAEDLKINTTDGELNINTQADGTITVTLNGQTISENQLSRYGVGMSKNNNVVTINYNGRTITQTLSTYKKDNQTYHYMNNKITGYKENDTGLLTQAEGALQISQGQELTNLDQFMVTGRTDSTVKQYIVGDGSLNSAMKEMLEDLNSGTGPIATRFRSGRGYTRPQWNEFIGTVAYAISADVNGDKVEDQALDIDDDGFTDGFDINHDGQMQDNEKVLFKLSSAYGKSATSMSWAA